MSFSVKQTNVSQTNRHQQQASDFLQNEDRVNWHDQALWFVRQKRDLATHAIPEWEQLRDLASRIKSHTLSRLDTYLEQFESQTIRNGVQVHWAANADEHNRIVLSILQKNNLKYLVKSKSMLTEECHLNPFLQQHGIEVTDTDLGERIIQLRNEPPSHIVMPAIHLKKEEVGELFHEKLQTEKGATDPKYLTEAARHHLRSRFLQASAALTGVNFAIAETGGVVVCTNEGNADMGVHLAPVQIHCMARKSSPDRKTWVFSPGCLPEVRPDNPSRSIRRITTARSRAEKCMSSSSITAGANTWEGLVSGMPSNVSVAAPV